MPSRAGGDRRIVVLPVNVIRSPKSEEPSAKPNGSLNNPNTGPTILSTLARRKTIRCLAAKLDSLAGHGVTEVDRMKRKPPNNNEGPLQLSETAPQMIQTRSQSLHLARRNAIRPLAAKFESLCAQWVMLCTRFIARDLFDVQGEHDSTCFRAPYNPSPTASSTRCRSISPEHDTLRRRKNMSTSWPRDVEDTSRCVPSPGRVRCTPWIRVICVYAHRAAASYLQAPSSYPSSSSLMPLAGSRYVVSGQNSSCTTVSGMIQMPGNGAGVKARVGKTGIAAGGMGRETSK